VESYAMSISAGLRMNSAFLRASAIGMTAVRCIDEQPHDEDNVVCASVRCFARACFANVAQALGPTAPEG
jgi:hypothetical protein